MRPVKQAEHYAVVIFQESLEKNYKFFRIGPFANVEELKSWCYELRQTAIDTHDDIFAYPELLIEPKQQTVSALPEMSCREIIEKIWLLEHPSW